MSQFLPDHQVAAVHRYTDKLISLIRDSSACQGRPVTCSAGCCACCSEPVYADKVEVAHALSGLAPGELDRVKERTAQWAVKTGQSGLLEQDLPNVHLWRALRAVCPFLENNRCMVYQNRPAACREHLAVGPPANCGSAELRTTQKFLRSDALEREIARYCVATFGRVNCDHVGVWLAHFLLDAELHSGSRRVLSRADIRRFVYARTVAAANP